MNQNTLGIIVGGLLPSLLYGFSTITMKAGAKYNISTSSYKMIIGIVIFLVGLVSTQIIESQESRLSTSAIALTIISGILWALGTTLVNFSIVKFDTPIAILTPIYNTNTLVAVLGGMILFAEWKIVSAVPVLIGTTLVVLGGIFLAKA